CYRIPVRAGRGFKAVAAASGGLGLRSNGTVVSWSWAPAAGRLLYVNEGLENILAIAVGEDEDSRLALSEDGTVTDWFDDWFGHRENSVPDELK
ncbi:MAG: hypothetical protein JW832_15335, partial [Deltaproteobacteria bacterium]|nr:hypothetical protein [Deltaproteobacteria bacterium]